MAEKSEVVFVGRKPAMNYVQAIITSLSMANAKEVNLKARGQAINTAVNVAEIAKNRFIKDLKVSKISIGSEELASRENETKSRMVSTIEITLSKE